MEIQLIAPTVMGKGVARERQGGGVGMRKKSMEGGNEPGTLLCSQGPSEGDSEEITLTGQDLEGTAI